MLRFQPSMSSASSSVSASLSSSLLSSFIRFGIGRAEKGRGVYHARAMLSWSSGAVGRIHVAWGSLLAEWNCETNPILGPGGAVIALFGSSGGCDCGLGGWVAGWLGDHTGPGLGIVGESMNEDYGCWVFGRGVEGSNRDGWRLRHLGILENPVTERAEGGGEECILDGAIVREAVDFSLHGYDKCKVVVAAAGEREGGFCKA